MSIPFITIIGVQVTSELLLREQNARMEAAQRIIKDNPRVSYAVSNECVQIWACTRAVVSKCAWTQTTPKQQPM